MNDIIGTDASELINGSVGDDYIEGRGGDDTVLGGLGADALVGNEGADVLDGGAEADTLAGDSGADLLLGGEGGDFLDGGANADTLLGGAGDDILINTALDGSDVIDGGEGEDALTLIFERSHYFIVQHADGSLEIRSLLDAAPETDIVRGVEWFSFDDFSALTAQQLVESGPGDFAPVAVADGLAVEEDAATPNLWDSLLANDTDADSGDTKTIIAVDTQGTAGAVIFDAAAQQLVYRAEGFEALEAGQTATDTFTYTMVDRHGVESTATVTMTVSGVSEDDGWISGTPGADVLIGTPAADRIRGLDGDDLIEAGRGSDLALGGGGMDTLVGGGGSDTLDGGSDTDVLIGGAGDDVFVFRRGEADGDRVLDFQGRGNKEDDLLVFEGYGEGAYLSRHGNEWTIHYEGGQETLWLNTPKLAYGDDYIFV